MLLAVILGVSLHLIVMLTVDNKPLAHAAHGTPHTLLLSLSSQIAISLLPVSCHSQLATEHVE